MIQCKKTETYRKGESIPFYLKGDTEDNLQLESFKLILYSTNSADIVIDKSEMTNTSDNEYFYEIPSSTTKDLNSGEYTFEVLFGTTSRSIGSGIAFKITDSHAKNYLT